MNDIDALKDALEAYRVWKSLGHPCLPGPNNPSANSAIARYLAASQVYFEAIDAQPAEDEEERDPEGVCPACGGPVWTQLELDAAKAEAEKIYQGLQEAIKRGGTGKAEDKA